MAIRIQITRGDRKRSLANRMARGDGKDTRPVIFEQRHRVCIEIHDGGIQVSIFIIVKHGDRLGKCVRRVMDRFLVAAILVAQQHGNGRRVLVRYQDIQLGISIHIRPGHVNGQHADRKVLGCSKAAIPVIAQQRDGTRIEICHDQVHVSIPVIIGNLDISRAGADNNRRPCFETGRAIVADQGNRVGIPVAENQVHIAIPVQVRCSGGTWTLPRADTGVMESGPQGGELFLAGRW